MIEELRRIATSLRGVPARLRLAWVAVLLVLVVVPPAVNAGRAEGYAASVEIFLSEEQAALRPSFAARATYVRLLLMDPLVPRSTVVAAGVDVNESDLLELVEVEPTERSVVLTVEAESPEHAVKLLRALVSQLANASARNAYAAAQERLVRIRQLIAAADGDPDPALIAERRALERLAAAPPFAIAAGPIPSPPRPSSAVDRAFDALPGPLPPKPDTLWTALAGLAVGLLLCATSALYAARRERRRTA